MTDDPRAALDRFIAALEAHYDAVVTRRGDDDPRVDDTYYVLADAFDVYDEALGEVHGEATPLVVDDSDDDDDDDQDDEDDDERHDHGGSGDEPQVPRGGRGLTSSDIDDHIDDDDQIHGSLS
ncbi:primosomal protein [Cellulomonas sp. PhB143]|uniref:primosomal protein n=1 Tax=Cellulomonas sp. PhB143 TaxID=2485186 RepID=UPI000F4AF596|nr:primosomal protein [Cellulomonas sp. PhB143]ROS74366.1 hypothetical protein EDF32_2110 [Cellulomonas sp. PhB143]